MKMKRTLSLLLALVLSLSLLAGCGGGNSDQPAQDPPPQQGGDTQTPTDTDKPAEPAEPAAPAAGPITVAALASGYEEAYPGMWQEVCNAFTTETGIEVNLICDKNLEDVIGPSMQGGDFPDVIHLATGREKGLTEQFIKDRNIADLTDVLSMTIPGESAKVGDKIVGGFTDTSVTNPYGDGKTYLAPMFYSPCGLFYNAGLFEEKGWSVPTTWDEMWELGDKAHAEDPEMYLFTYPTTGYFDTFIPSMLYSAGGVDFYNKALRYEEGIWDTPEAQTFFDITAKLASYTNPITPAQANDQDFTQNQQLVLDNKALFMPNGTWVVGEMAEAPRADNFKWGMTALPAAKAGGAGVSYCWLEQAWIPAQAPNMDAAKQFVAFLYSDAACAIFAKGNAIQPVPGLTGNLEGDNKMFYAIYDNGAEAAMGGFAAYNAVAGLGSVREEFQDPFNGLVNGSLTKEDWIAGVKEASDQMRANLMG
ncbi:MAG: carbohydrate ABC transporter substrate-binding protein [Oscillospiraceae bacterium]|jgi:N-acetylglucosamine transport system substrate-binding protein|nr:carbohydrate ABC transporter substrate-binding protein [Oscillospiraceae bacterium]